MSSSVYLLGRGDEFRDSLEEIIKPGIEKLTDEQLQSTIEMLRNVAALGNAEVEIKTKTLAKIEQLLEITGNSLIMPRKSTYFHPKILSGLVFNKIDPYETVYTPRQ